MQVIERHIISFFSYSHPVLENRLTRKEKMEEGSLRWSIYHHYIRAGGGMICQLPCQPQGSLSDRSCH